jgi:hypothetical protein
VATLIDPVGPEASGVYWRRRLVVLGVLLVVLLLLFQACSGGGGDSDAASDTTAEPTVSQEAEPSDEPSRTASASPSASSTTEPARACRDEDVVVTANPGSENYATGAPVNITFVVGTKDGVRCKRDVGGAANEVRVVSGGSQIIWSSDYCSPGGEKDTRTLGPDDSYSVIVEWDGDVTTSDCPDDRLPAPAGNYTVVGRNGDLLSTPVPLTLG